MKNRTRRPLVAANLATAAAAVISLLAIHPVPALAQGGINVTVNGDVVPFAGQQPIERFGSVLVPLRGVFEKLGATVAYDGPTKSILAVKGSTSVTLQLGSASASVNGQPRTLSVPAQAVNGTTLVPLRFVSEALGADVRWSSASRTVIIATNGMGGGAPAPASAQPAPTEVVVTSLTHDAEHALRAGEILHVQLHGTSGGTAAFTIPGVETARDVVMKETEPGTYAGAFTVPQGINVRGAAVLASIKKAGERSPAIQAAEPISIDTIGPTVGDLSPAPNASLAPGRPLIYATFSDAGTGVDPSATRILIDDHDVTADATVTNAFFSYRPPADLPAGKSAIVVSVRDRAGNVTKREWAFQVAQDSTAIRALTFSPGGGELHAGDTLTIRMEAQPAGKAHFSVGGSLKDSPMQEQSPGVYVGTYVIKRGDSLAKAPVTATFVSSTGRTVTQTAGSTVTIAAGPPAAPTITAPKSGASVGDSVTFTGTATPGATVRYHIQYQGVLLILPAGGTVTDGEVKADAKGNWSVANVSLPAPPGISKLTYTVEVTTVDAAGQASDPVSVDFRR